VDGLLVGEEAVVYVIERIVATLGVGSMNRHPTWTRDGSRVQTRFLCALFAQLLSDPVEVPAIWDAFQFVLSNVLEDEA
jgi:hypothetical protein